MKTTNFAKKLIMKAAALVTVCSLAFAGIAFAPAPAYAATSADEGTPGPFADGSGLEFICREQRRMLEGQQDRLNLANDIAAKSQTWINEQKSKGKDVSALEAALSAYKSAIASAQAKHDQAQSTFNTQAGFDGNCKLTDRDQARTTLRTVGDALREAHRLIADANREFRRAVQDWRRANRPATPTAAP
jgi:hypothetical protein